MALVFSYDLTKFASSRFSVWHFLCVTSPYLIKVASLVASRRSLAIVLRACEFDSSCQRQGSTADTAYCSSGE